MASNRFLIRHPGEFYYDLLQIEAWIKNRSLSEEACNLLSVRLMQREEYRNKMLDHLAWKRGISRQELIEGILKGEAEPLSKEEYRNIDINDPDQDDD